MSARGTVKALAEAFLADLGPAAIGRLLFQRRALILAYHNVMPAGGEEGGDRPLHISIDDFRAQLDVLERHVQVVPLQELLAPPGPDSRGPRVAITFDDAYRGAVTVGLPELAKRGLPATMFVAPGCLGGEGFWWDRIHADSGGGLPEELRATALDAGRGRTEEVLPLAVRLGCRVGDVPDHARPAHEDELAQAAGENGLTLAPHTWTHPNLTRLTRSELLPELERPLTWLRQRFSGVQPWLAYPYGLMSCDVARAAVECGYTTGLLVAGGWLPTNTPPAFRIPRLNVPSGLSLNGFVLKVSGVLS
jgi:peptidoglycan/xylan/chitin deacetylase (PgdA/CDA1 family)